MARYYTSCHEGQSILEVGATLLLGTAETEALKRSWFKTYSNGRFHAMVGNSHVD